MKTDPLDVIIDGDLGQESLRYYLKSLLVTMWKEGEGFNGKRPFGNSDWKWRVYQALVESKHLDGTLDEDGYIEELDIKKADKYIIQQINRIFNEN